MRENYPVMKGAESFYIKGNNVGLLLSHGFMGTPQSVRYLGEKLSELGYTVYAPRLEGHGTHYKDMEKTTYLDWFSDLETGYMFLKEQCSKIFIIGQSMGGTLALWLASKYKDITGLVLINAALSVPNYEQWIGRSSPRYLSESAPDIKLQGVHEITYNKVPIQSIHELQALMRKTPEKLQNITNSILCFKSAEDHVVPPVNTDYIAEQIGSFQKEVVTLYHSYHVASMDHDKEEMTKRIHKYIQRNLNEAKLIDRGA